MEYDWSSPANPSGQPPRFWRGEQLSFIMNGPAPPRDGFQVAKWVDDPEEWKKANAAYKAARGRVIRPLIVKDQRRDPRDYRTWSLRPELVDGRPAVYLLALTDPADSFGGLRTFRGQEAIVAEPFLMTRAIRPVVAYISEHEDFDRVQVPASFEGGWGSSSRTLAEMQNCGIVVAKPGAAPRPYAPDDPLIGRLKSDKDREHAPGRKTVYVKGPAWDSFLQQWSEFLSGKERSTPYLPP